MARLYTPSPEQVAKLAEDKVCAKCNITKPRVEFSLQRSYSEQKGEVWRIRSRCKKCEAIGHRKLVGSATIERLVSQVAPMRAAIKLLETNPTALAGLVQRHRVEYTRLLDEERTILLARRGRNSDTMFKVNGKYE